MSVRFNITNTGGVQSQSGGNMPTDNATNKTLPLSRATNGALASVTVVSNGHAVEVDGDGGLWDTVSGAIVLRDLTNIDCIGT